MEYGHDGVRVINGRGLATPIALHSIAETIPARPAASRGLLGWHQKVERHGSEPELAISFERATMDKERSCKRDPGLTLIPRE